MRTAPFCLPWPYAMAEPWKPRSGTRVTDADREKRAAGRAAAGYMASGMAVGVGTGSTVRYFIDALGERVRDEDLTVRGIPTSGDSAEKMKARGIEVVGFDEVNKLDVAVDGADEVSAEFHMIKGGGGALLREKIVLTAAERRVIIIDSSKQVKTLGAFDLPVEVIPFGHEYVLDTIAQTGATPRVRQSGGGDFHTDNGNLVLDCAYGSIADPRALEGVLKGIPGVVETGLFLGLVDELLVGRGDEVETVTANKVWG